MQLLRIIGPTVFGLVIMVSNSLPAAEPAKLLADIKAVGPEGRGNTKASAALQELVQCDATVLPTILESMDDANPLAANWLRNAVETIADRSLRSGEPLPIEDLEQFALDRKRDPRARRLAYEWLVRVDSSVSERLIPGMLHDPSPEFRRDAVRRLLGEAEALRDNGEKEEAKRLYREALSGATDVALVKEIVKALKQLGETVDLTHHFGFLTRWSVVGPFDHRGGIGFDAVYPPEKHVNLQATYEGQLGQVAWKTYETDHEYGIFDIAKLIENFKGSAMYCATEFVSPSEQDVELRLGTPNSWKIWLNGEFLFGREEYHRGMDIDQYRVKATLKRGKNTLLLKICQNEQPHDWAQRYQFQFRVCNASGLAVHSKEKTVATTSRADQD